MKKIKIPSIVFFFILCIKILLAQNSSIDSLKLQLETATGDEYINSLNELGIAYWHIDPQQSIRYGKQAIAQAEADKHFTFYARAHNVTGGGYYYLKCLDSAIFFIEKRAIFQNRI